MIVPLGSWAIGEACRHLVELAPNGPGAPWVSVNVAARQLSDPALLDIVDRAYIIYDGRVLFAGSPEELVADANVRRLYLGEGFSL